MFECVSELCVASGHHRLFFFIPYTELQKNAAENDKLSDLFMLICTVLDIKLKETINK